MRRVASASVVGGTEERGSRREGRSGGSTPLFQRSGRSTATRRCSTGINRTDKEATRQATRTEGEKKNDDSFPPFLLDPTSTTGLSCFPSLPSSCRRLPHVPPPPPLLPRRTLLPPPLSLNPLPPPLDLLPPLPLCPPRLTALSPPKRPYDLLRDAEFGGEAGAGPVGGG